MQDDDDDGSGGDALPTVAFVGPPEFFQGSPDRIEIRYELKNDDEGELSVRVEVEELRVDESFQLVTGGDGQPIVAGPRMPAVPLDESPPTSGLPSDVVVPFLWDVKANLGENSAMVRCVGAYTGYPGRSTCWAQRIRPVSAWIAKTTAWSVTA